MSLVTGEFTPWKSKRDDSDKQRMAGDYLKEFTNESNVMKVLRSKDNRNGVRNFESSSGSSGSSSNSSSNTNNSQSTSMEGYVAPKPETWKPGNAKEYTGFQGGEIGVDSPDLNYGAVITSPSGTKTQYGADGSMKTWGTDEALESALKSKQDKKISAQPGRRKVDYNTNLPSDFDPAGKDAYGHNMMLYELTGVKSFLDAAQGMKNL